MNNYTTLINKHDGENCFILGAGPSLYYNIYHSMFPLLGIYGKIISVNSSVLAWNNFDYWISNDALCRRWDWWRDVKLGRGIKIVRNSWEKYKDELDGFLFFEPRPTSEDIVNPDDIGLAYCSSIPSALDLAIQMGFKKIFILGLDHTDLEGKQHYWEFWEKRFHPKASSPAQGSWEQRKGVFDINMKAFKALKKFADEKDIGVYNLNCVNKKGQYITKVRTFKRIQMDGLENILGSVDEYLRRKYEQ